MSTASNAQGRLRDAPQIAPQPAVRRRTVDYGRARQPRGAHGRMDNDVDIGSPDPSEAQALVWPVNALSYDEAQRDLMELRQLRVFVAVA